MNWQYTPYTLWLGGTGIFLVLFAGYVWRSDSDQAVRGRYLATMLLITAAGYNFAYLLTLSQTALDIKLALNHIELVMLLPLTWTWLAYVQWYTRRDSNPSRRLVRVAGLISIGLIGMAITNPVHRLVYESATLEQVGSFVALDLVVGPGFRLYQGYVYILLLGSLALLTTAVIQTRGVIRRQAVSLLILSLIPGIAGGADILGLTPYTSLNLAALSSTISAAAIVVTVRRFRWLDLAPVSRDNLFDAVEDPIVVINGQYLILDSNAQFDNIVRHPSDTVVGEKLVDVVPELEQLFIEGTEPEVSEDIEIERGETTRIYDARSSPLVPTNQERLGWLVVFRDITPRKVAEQQLIQERDRLDEFASMVSHDLRNPLNVAHGNVELALQETGNEHLEHAQQAISRMDELIDDMLVLAREGQSIGEKSLISAEAVVSESWGTVDAPDASLVIEGPLPELRADKGRVRQLLENLFRNAVEHSEGSVTITVGSDENGFFVADDGPGIPPDERESVFEPGYSTNRNGTGFGLAIVEQIAKAHDWSLTIEESRSNGASFHIQTGE
ncbi:PAS domain-containing protein [Haloarcula sp. Atlit-47R]|uniref:histidine kinase N-terminal 7TM domain-containing protein n=1 Tax=Haloarcula sp. Atlit-47R TaxID=2282132 RepID=UPI000EF2458D|nr:histidine kinase N-terminal 7TM domain-containing protein [Haloarcula sp. Atlit-47R]RLM42012.1 PAS domain-containing protein [Haloarcula sp. Atlit-47R]